MYKGFKHTLKYISLVGILCAYMTACANADRQSAAEQSGTEILQEPLEETPIPEPESTPVPEKSPEPESSPKPEEVIDNTQANTEKFYRISEEDYGLSHEQAQSWFDIVTEDDIFDGAPEKSVICCLTM